MKRLLLVACALVLGCVDSASTAGPDPMTDPDPDPDPDPDTAGIWGTARDLHDLPGTSSYPTLALDEQGNALAVWEQSHQTSSYAGLWSRRRVAGQWQAPVRITQFPDLASEVVLAGSYAAWMQSINNERRIVTSRHDGTGAWESVATLRASSWQQGSLLQPRLAVGGGHAAMVWAHQDPATQRYTLEIRHRPDTGTWSAGAPAAVSGIKLATYSRPLYDVAFDDSGAVVVTWVEVQTDRTEVWARVGEPTEGSLSISWQAASKVATILGDPNQIPVRELWTGTHAGRSYAAWLRVHDDGLMSITASHLHPGGTWDAEQPTQQIKSSHYAAPRFAAGATGHKVVLWREPLMDSSRVVARTYDPNVGWGGDEIVADALQAPYLGCIDLDAHFFDVAIDPSGNAIALWEERLPEKDANGRSVMGVWSSQLAVGTGWQPPVRIDGNSGNAMVPHAALAALDAGVGLFALDRADGTRTLSVNELAPAAK